MKDLQISKELIKAVLEKQTENLSEDFSFYIHKGYIIFSDEGEQLFDYNIYKFTFKCKEWAMNKGYQIISGPSDEPAYRHKDERAYSKVLWYEGDDLHREYKDIYFMENTEVEAVFKASEFILKEISENTRFTI